MSIQIQFEQLFDSVFLYKCTSSTDYFFSKNETEINVYRPLIILIGFSFQISFTSKCRQSRLTLF